MHWRESMVAPIKDKMVESSVWWFGLARRRQTEAT